MAAIFKNRLPVTSGSIRSSAIEIRSPENVELTVGISFLSYLEADM